MKIQVLILSLIGLFAIQNSCEASAIGNVDEIGFYPYAGYSSIIRCWTPPEDESKFEIATKRIYWHALSQHEKDQSSRKDIQWVIVHLPMYMICIPPEELKIMENRK